MYLNAACLNLCEKYFLSLANGFCLAALKGVLSTETLRVFPLSFWNRFSYGICYVKKFHVRMQERTLKRKLMVELTKEEGFAVIDSSTFLRKVLRETLPPHNPTRTDSLAYILKKQSAHSM